MRILEVSRHELTRMNSNLYPSTPVRSGKMTDLDGLDIHLFDASRLLRGEKNSHFPATAPAEIGQRSQDKRKEICIDVPTFPPVDECLSHTVRVGTQA
jgi:hypothetical protein